MSFNSSYKKWHKPNQSPEARTKQGYYKVQNIDKYVGDPNLVIYRSSWEHSFCRWADFSPSILQWSSEPISIPYYDRVSKLEECQKFGLDPNNPKNWTVKHYNTDYWIKIDKGNGIVEKWFVEVKPSMKLKKPTPPPTNAPLKDVRRFNAAAKEYFINEAKFAAITAWAERNNSKFYVFTEDVLRSLLGRFWPANNE